MQKYEETGNYLGNKKQMFWRKLLFKQERVRDDVSTLMKTTNLCTKLSINSRNSPLCVWFL